MHFISLYYFYDYYNKENDWLHTLSIPVSAGLTSGVLAAAVPFAFAGVATLVALFDGDTLGAALAGVLAAVPPRAAAPPLAGVEDPFSAAAPRAGWIRFRSDEFKNTLRHK